MEVKKDLASNVIHQQETLCMRTPVHTTAKRKYACIHVFYECEFCMYVCIHSQEDAHRVDTRHIWLHAFAYICRSHKQRPKDTSANTHTHTHSINACSRTFLAESNAGNSGTDGRIKTSFPVVSTAIKPVTASAPRAGLLKMGNGRVVIVLAMAECPLFLYLRSQSPSWLPAYFWR